MCVNFLVCFGLSLSFSLQGIEELADGEWGRLRSLSLAYNSLGAASGFSISRLLTRTRELRELSLAHCGLSDLTLQLESGLLGSIKSESRNVSIGAIKADPQCNATRE